MWRECRERARLENALVDAIEALYGSQSTDKLARRERQREAVRRLEEHIDIHRCREPLNASRAQSAKKTRAAHDNGSNVSTQPGLGKAH